MKKVRLTAEIYSVIGLHAAKYFDHAVLGYIIGTENGNQFDITDIIPIAHSVPAGATLEIIGQIVRASILFPLLFLRIL